MDENSLVAKRLVEVGGASELLAAYDGPVGLLGVRRGQLLRVDQLEQAPVIALALRRTGRVAEADRLLRDADASVQNVYRHNHSIPFRFDAEAAAIWAAQGRTEQALSALERAFDRGWTHTSSTDLPDIADEPAFRSLRGQPRFERLRAELAAHFATERADTIRLRI
jgi:hypothetical protein